MLEGEEKAIYVDMAELTKEGVEDKPAAAVDSQRSWLSRSVEEAFE